MSFIPQRRPPNGGRTRDVPGYKQIRAVEHTLARGVAAANVAVVRVTPDGERAPIGFYTQRRAEGLAAWLNECVPVEIKLGRYPDGNVPTYVTDATLKLRGRQVGCDLVVEREGT